MFRIVFPRSKPIAKPVKDFVTFEMFAIAILAEDRFSFATWLSQTSVQMCTES